MISWFPPRATILSLHWPIRIWAKSYLLHLVIPKKTQFICPTIRDSSNHLSSQKSTFNVRDPRQISWRINAYADSKPSNFFILSEKVPDQDIFPQNPTSDSVIFDHRQSDWNLQDALWHWDHKSAWLSLHHKLNWQSNITSANCLRRWKLLDTPSLAAEDLYHLSIMAQNLELTFQKWRIN